MTWPEAFALAAVNVCGFGALVALLWMTVRR